MTLSINGKTYEVGELIAYHERLEKENTELRNKLEILILVGNACTKGLSEQLIKAERLLAKWVELYKPKVKDFPKPPIQVDTEKFLSEVKND